MTDASVVGGAGAASGAGVAADEATAAARTGIPNFFPEGVFTAIVTPFHEDGSVDISAYEALLRRQIDAKVAGVIVHGSTGEAIALSRTEQRQLLETALKLCAGTGLQVLAGTGSPDTATTIERTREAVSLGVSACMIVAPCYLRPTQEGIMAHIRAVAAAVPTAKLMLYNNPARAGVSIAPSTVAALRRELPAQIVAVKESSGSVDAVSDIAAACDIPILCGEDALTLPMMALGARGLCSVVSNLIPKNLVALVSAANNGDVATARMIHFKLLPFFRGLFIEPNPVPLKRALQLRGFIPSAHVRLPLVPLSPEADARIMILLREARMI